MKNLIISLTLFILCFPHTVKASNYDRILVVDISGSMRRDNLHERIKRAFREYVAKCRIGDRIILMTFGSDVNPGVEDRVIREAEDIAEIQRKIDEFQFNDQWTWMTKAFDIIFKRVIDLHKAYPDRKKEIYIFTDGNNEPPPGHEDDFTFEEIIEKYGEIVKKMGEEGKTFIYVVMFGVRPEEKLEEFAKETNIEVVQKPRTPRTETESIKKVALTIEPRSFESEPRDSITKDFTVKISELMGIEEVTLKFQTAQNLKISPGEIQIREGRLQNEKFKVKFENLKVGIQKYKVKLISDEDINIQPSNFEFEIKIKKPLKIPAWAWLVPLIIILCLGAGFIYIYFFCPKWPEGYYVVRKQKTGDEYKEVERIEVREHQKFCRGKVTSEDLGFYDVFFELRIDRNGIVTKKIKEGENEEETEISSGDNIIGNYFFEIKEV